MKILLNFVTYKIAALIRQFGSVCLQPAAPTTIKTTKTLCICLYKFEYPCQKITENMTWVRYNQTMHVCV